MFRFESYITPILLSYVDKYVQNFNPADAQVSLWAGGVTLHNLVLKAGVLQQEVSLPFTLVSGRIHELLIQVPWTKIMSEPIVVTIKTIECVLSLNPPADDTPPPEAQSGKTQVVEAPPGYMQALVRRIVSNIAVRVNSLILKYVHDDVVLSLTIKRLSVDSVGVNWEPAFADIDMKQPAIRRLIRLDDLTLCLDKRDSDGKIRFYNDPLLYRCQLDLRVLTKLVSANTRRARSLNVQLISSTLSWSVNSEQLVLLLRLLRERETVEVKPPPPTPKQSVELPPAPLHPTSSNSAEPVRQESWSEWAWSWLPAWDREGVEETPAPATPIPISFTAHFDLISLMFKILESEGTKSKRARAILELTASDAVIKSTICKPTLIRLNFGARTVSFSAHGKCVCGYDRYLKDIQDEPFMYLSNVEGANEEPWSWADEDLEDAIETGVAVAEDDEHLEEADEEFHEAVENLEKVKDFQPQVEVDQFWIKMDPVIYFEYNHERSPSSAFVNPYDNPPKDFEFSDWVEKSSAIVSIQPILFNVSTGLLHRLAVITKTLEEVPQIKENDMPMRILTVEECDALSENLPQRLVNFDVTGLRIRIIPTDHTHAERPSRTPLVLDLQIPKASMVITTPLYPQRVCAAACQMLEDSGPIWQGSRLHVSLQLTVQAGICSPNEDTPRLCGRANVELVSHRLLNSKYFELTQCVLFGYTVRIQEVNICGSAARLQAAYNLMASIIQGKLTTPLSHTTLAKDALSDEGCVAIDVTLEELCLRGYITKNINTHFVSLNTARATALHSTREGELRQAWLYSGPETPTTTPYLKAAGQWCKNPSPKCLEYVNLFIEPTAVSLDPMLVAWLSYRSKPIPISESISQLQNIKNVSSQSLSRRRVTPPSSSGRGGSRSGSGSELIHMRPRSIDSSSERSEKKELKRPKVMKAKAADPKWTNEQLLNLYDRLNRLLMMAEVGLVQVFISREAVSALDCANVRDAMERHAATGHRVLVVNLGRLATHSNSLMKHMWQDVKHDHPTFNKPKRDPNVSEDSFPWKIRISDVSCYTIEVRPGTEKSGKDKSMIGLKSQLKASRVVIPRTVLELVATTITLTVVTKTLDIKIEKKRETRKKHVDHNTEEDKMKYFETGIDFKPSNFKEFIRGPSNRKSNPDPGPSQPAKEPETNKLTVKSGPVISLGVNVHADTPPILVKLDQEQVQTVFNAMHCFAHIMALFRRPPNFGTSQKPLVKSASDLDQRESQSDETLSENRSEPLITIYEAPGAAELTKKMKTFLLFQWVVSRANLMVATPEVKLVFDVDDVMLTIDLQNNYNQMKIKIASGSIRHYNRTGSDDWTPGPLGGRILEVREPTHLSEANNFLSVTITQALISDLPAGWKEDLQQKILEANIESESMWEVYATLASLEAIMQPELLDHLISWLHEVTPNSTCIIKAPEIKRSVCDWPLCYISAGGLRLLLNNGRDSSKSCDDTLMFVVGKVTVSPHPVNPIIRQSVETGHEQQQQQQGTWTPLTTVIEGRQYEVLINNVSIRSAQFQQLVSQEAIEYEQLKSTGGENPALKWSQPSVSPIIVPIVHSVDFGCILAPAIYTCGALISGPAIDFNVLSDCCIELGIERLDLIRSLTQNLLQCFRQRPTTEWQLEEDLICPYASLIDQSSINQNPVEPRIVESEVIASTSQSQTEASKLALDTSRSFVFDSGVDSTSTHSTYRRRRPSVPMKKSVSIAAFNQSLKESDFLEVFVTMGVIDISLYIKDDNSVDIKKLRPPPGAPVGPTEPRVKVVVNESKGRRDQDEGESLTETRSLTETVRQVDVGKTKLEEMHVLPLARKAEGNLPLVHVTLRQPNLYYCNKNKQKTIQISLFDAWLGLGAGEDDSQWNAPILTTKRGLPDPLTDITPALATLRVELKNGSPISKPEDKSSIAFDVERPVMLDVCTDRVRRLIGITDLIKKNVSWPVEIVEDYLERPAPILYKIRRKLVAYKIDSTVIQTDQLAIRGSEGAVGVGAVRLQIAAGLRPDRLTFRGLVDAALITAGPASDHRHIVLKPLMIGATVEATWEAWRTAEGGLNARDPTIKVCVEVDRIIVDLRPADLAAAVRIRNNVKEILESVQKALPPEVKESEESILISPKESTSFFNQQFASDNSDTSNQFYKDDLRSGAFKIIVSSQLPMAYQITLYQNTVSWKYPQPRAITRLIAFPIPGFMDEEIECVLELYCPMLSRWEQHTYFRLPAGEPREFVLSSSPTEAVYALTWRVRTCSNKGYKTPPYNFDAMKFMPRQNPTLPEPLPINENFDDNCSVKAEHLAGVLRIDSYFAPKFLPRMRLALRLSVFELHAHNSLPVIHKSSKMEGYYVTRPLMRSHCVLTLSLRDAAAHCVLATTPTLLMDGRLSSDIIESSTGTMEQFIEEFRIQGTVSLCKEPRLRLRGGHVRMALHVPRMDTLRALFDDWSAVFKQCVQTSDTNTSSHAKDTSSHIKEADPTEALSGRISLWIHNESASALRIGQEGTEELMPLAAGASLAYRWRAPLAPKKIRFALVTPETNWRWSRSIPFVTGSSHVRLDDADAAIMGMVFLYVRVRDSGTRRDMYLSGRLTLANMMRQNILYKVRIRYSDKYPWHTICSGEIAAENIGLSVLCTTRCEATFKVKFSTDDENWSGDIPLAECRKENVPWLVKVPSVGDLAYMCMWCRVTRARSDDRLLATFWPLFMLRSHIPLDVDVLIMSNKVYPVAQPDDAPHLVQTAESRGKTTHLVVPGTTSARHKLTFQYRNIDCPVTPQAVSLYYGVTPTSVFEKMATVVHIEDVIEVLQKWLEHSGLDAPSNWPYSIVTNHWQGQWKPALLQPRCDVNVSYVPVHAGGGCSLEVQLRPVALLANASPIMFTLRAHDATPLCRLEPGVAISPPMAILQKPFFMSVEVGRETFVSEELQICKHDPGRYGKPPPGQIALDRATNFVVHCNQKVALLTMYYEIKDDINVLGITSSYMLINKLPTVILVSAIAVPMQRDEEIMLRPNTFKFIHPHETKNLQGIPLAHFWMSGRWRGGDPHELWPFLCLALPSGTYPASAPVPILLGVPPVRRGIGLKDKHGQSMAVVITQVNQEGRWVVTVAEDPCPQFVIQNRTTTTLAVAQPEASDDTNIKAVPDCDGTLWSCLVESGDVIHYSTPAYCARYPPPPHTLPAYMPFLTVGYAREKGHHQWCQPFAVADGEQLLQISRGATIKVRVHTYPHSTLIDLQDVDHNDLSASDIRRRLLSFYTDEPIQPQTDIFSRMNIGMEVRNVNVDKQCTSEAVYKQEMQAVYEEDQPSTSQLKQVYPKRDSGASGFAENAEADRCNLTDSSLMKLSGPVREDIEQAYKNEILSTVTNSFASRRKDSIDSSETSYLMEAVSQKEWTEGSEVWPEKEWVRSVFTGITVTLGASAEVPPLIALHLQRAGILVNSDTKKIRMTVAITDVQVDNNQYETEEYDFAVVATTRPVAEQWPERWPALWGMLSEKLRIRSARAKLFLRTCCDTWTVAGKSYRELTEMELMLGPLGLYIEDAYLHATLDLFHLAIPPIAQTPEMMAITENRVLQYPLRFRKLQIYSLDLTLTLHTAVRMYIALDESPLRLSAFHLQDVMTSQERLTHALTVHYLSAAILGAGWVVGGLELLGAPGALAARVGNAGGGVRGVASTAAGALLRSLSAAAGSLARNLDLLGGDDDHARRAAAARRRPPPNLVAGLVAGVTNFAINMLGAVGGLAHHPLVGVAVGESGSSAAGLRRGLLGAITKPLSATADLVAYAGQGLLTQTGWDPVPRPRPTSIPPVERTGVPAGWRRDCVRWGFHFSELDVIAGFEAMLDEVLLRLLITHKYLVIVEPEMEKIVEMIDFKFCTIGPYKGEMIELHIAKKRPSRSSESRPGVDEDNEFQLSAAAMARVARFTGAPGYNADDKRMLSLLPTPGLSHSLRAIMCAVLQSNDDSHFALL